METVKCPECNSNLAYNLNDNILRCNYCGTLCNMSEVYVTDTEFLNNRLMDVNENICPDCGGKLISDINTISTKCLYCGSSLVYTEKISKVFKPRKILLFEKRLDEIKSRLEKMFSDLDEKNLIIEKISPIYLPFWKYDFSEGYTILVDAANNLSDTLADKFDEVFNLSKLKNFELELLAGNFALEFDITSKNIYKRALEKLSKQKNFKKPNYDLARELNLMDLNYRVMYVLLPFYYIQVDSIKILIDGQNGKIFFDGESSHLTEKIERKIKNIQFESLVRTKIRKSKSFFLNILKKYMPFWVLLFISAIMLIMSNFTANIELQNSIKMLVVLFDILISLIIAAIYYLTT